MATSFLYFGFCIFFIFTFCCFVLCIFRALYHSQRLCSATFERGAAGPSVSVIHTHVSYPPLLVAVFVFILYFVFYAVYSVLIAIIAITTIDPRLDLKFRGSRSKLSIVG